MESALYSLRDYVLSGDYEKSYKNHFEKIVDRIICRINSPREIYGLTDGECFEVMLIVRDVKRGGPIRGKENVQAKPRHILKIV